MEVDNFDGLWIEPSNDDAPRDEQKSKRFVVKATELFDRVVIIGGFDEASQPKLPRDPLASGKAYKESCNEQRAKV